MFKLFFFQMLLPLQELVQHYETSQPNSTERNLLTPTLSLQAQMLAHGNVSRMKL